MPEGKSDCLLQTTVLSGFRQFYKAMLIYNSWDISSCHLSFPHTKHGALKAPLLKGQNSTPCTPGRLLFHGRAQDINKTFLCLKHSPWVKESTASIRPYPQIPFKYLSNENRLFSSWPYSVLNFHFTGWSTQPLKFPLPYTLHTRSLTCPRRTTPLGGWWGWQQLFRGPTTSFLAEPEWPGCFYLLFWRYIL